MNIIEVTSAVIIPALSLIVTAIGLRCEIKVRQAEQHSSEREKREKIEQDLLEERNGHHDDLIAYLHDDIINIRAEINSFRNTVSDFSAQMKLFEYDLRNIKEQHNISEKKLHRADDNIEKVLDMLSDLKYDRKRDRD